MAHVGHLHPLRQQFAELRKVSEAGGQVSEQIVLAVDMHGDNVDVVRALRVSQAAQQALEQRASAAALVRGESHAGVINTEADDAVGEALAVLLEAVDKGAHLLVLHVGGLDALRAPAAPVEHPVEDIAPPPPGHAGGVAFERDHGKGGVREEDARPLHRVGELPAPPQRIGAAAVIERSETGGGVEGQAQAGPQALEVGAPPPQHLGGKAQLPHHAFQVLGPDGVAAEQAVDVL